MGLGFRIGRRSGGWRGGRTRRRGGSGDGSPRRRVCGGGHPRRTRGGSSQAESLGGRVRDRDRYRAPASSSATATTFGRRSGDLGRGAARNGQSRQSRAPQVAVRL
jgi:hypothetical protein